MSEPESDPLPSARVYRMFEGFLLSAVKGETGSVFSRIGFELPKVTAVATPSAREARGASGAPGTEVARGGDLPVVRIAVADNVPFPAFDEVVASSVVDDAASGCQRVWFVRHAAGEVFLDRVSLRASAGAQAGEAAPVLERATYPLAQKWVRSVAGENPKTRMLLVTGTSADGVVVGTFDASSGKITQTWTLPGTRPGVLVGSWLVAQDFTTWLFVTVRVGAALSTVAVDVPSLAGEKIPLAAVRLLPDVPVAAASGAAGTLGRMLPASAAQQLILVATDPSGEVFVVMQGFDAGKPAQLHRAVVDTKFAKPRSAQQYRLTCADLDNNGQEELVVGYAADYGGAQGAGAFVLLRFDPEKKKLEATSNYVADGPGTAALASMDLRLGSGILGDAITSGVFVLGAGGDMSHNLKGQAQIFAGIVPVNPVTLRFPPYTEVPATLPAVTQVAITALKAPGILGSLADMFGLSVTLGQPRFIQRPSRGQLLAILQAPPFDLDHYREKPSLNFSQSESRVKGLSVSSSKDWSMSKDAGLSIGIDSSALNFHTGTSYGRGFSKTEDSSTTTGVQISRTPTQLDRLVTIAISYSVWEYPITRSSRGGASGGTMLVIFPASAIPVQETPIAYDALFGYRAPYEPGSLLTYMNADLDGWDETKQGKLLLFTPLVSLEVTNDLPDTNTYDWSDANQNTIGENYYVSTTTSTSANLLKQTSLFSYLPLSFGLQLSSSETYSDAAMQMTSLSRTEALTISVSGGTVKDASLRYTVTPYIYQHAGLGATVVAFKVSNLGPGWRSRYSSPWPMLMLPFRTLSKDPFEALFSRSIGFEDQADGSVNIVVEVFNQGFTDADIVNVHAYLGRPKFVNGVPVIPPQQDLIGTVNGRVPALGRHRLRVKWQPVTKPSFVTAVVFGGDRYLEIAEIAWNVYPESAFTSLDLPGVQDV